jgi:thioredoxin-like negative regulator of GroEL
MATPKHASDDLDVGELKATTATSTVPTIVQFGSEQCAHCPPATVVMSQLTADFEFVWVYQDCLSKLAEEFQIAKLPALAVWGGSVEHVLIYQGLRGDQVKDIVARHCKRRLILDAVF